MNIWLQLAIGITALWLVWRFLIKQFGRTEPSESLDEPLVEDPFSGVRSRKKRGPQNRSGAIALAEPDDDEEDENRSFPRVLRKSQIANLKSQSLPEGFGLKKEERDVLRLLSRFPEVVEEAAIRYAPNVLCSYLFELAQAFNLFYQKFPILKSEKETKNFRIFLTANTGEILKDGLGLLGIKAPEQM